MECIKKSIVEIGSTIMIVESERKVCSLHKNCRSELPFSKMTDIESESKICGMHKTST